MVRRAGAPDVHALARKAAGELPRFRGKAGDVDPSQLNPSERRQVIASVAKQAQLSPGEVAEQLLPLWGGETVDRGLAAGQLLDAGGLSQREVRQGGFAQEKSPGVFGGLGIALAVKGQLGVDKPPAASDLKGTAWEHVGADYRPEHKDTPPVILAHIPPNKDGWRADPEDMTRKDLEGRLTYETGGKLLFDKEGKPLNPAGPTGKTGRVLGKWGPNHAADPVIIRRNPETGVHEMLAIQRKDTGQWAIPGGMVDEGERISGTLARELEEETGVKLDMTSAVPVYEGIVKADPRNTDNAWMETSVCLKVLSDAEAAALRPKAADDAAKVKWMPLTPENLDNLYASHGDFVRGALDVMAQKDVELRRAGAAGAVDTLAPELQGLPEPLKKLCVELDGLWGNADGKVSVDELDRVARYTLQALPFFTEEAAAIVQLAEALGYAGSDEVGKLKSGLAQLDPGTRQEQAAYRQALDEAIAQSDQRGPDLIRDIAKHQPRWHRLSILEHTAAAVAAVAAFSDQAGLDWPGAGAIMLLHDIGKILERPTFFDEGGNQRWHFGGHEDVGAKWLEQRGFDGDLVFHVRHHGDIRGKSVEEILDLCQGDTRRMQEFVVVALADTLAKGDTPDLRQSFSDVLAPKLEDLCKRSGLDAEAMFGRYYELRGEWFT